MSKPEILQVRSMLDDISTRIEAEGIGGGGLPPTSFDMPRRGDDDDGMKQRIEALEKAVKNLATKADLDGLRQDFNSARSDMGTLRRETKAEWSEFTNASKSDFAGLRADMAEGREAVHKLLLENARWTHTALISMISVAVIGILGLLLTIWNTAKPAPQQQAISQPVQQPPIIINVPQAAPAPIAPTN